MSRIGKKEIEIPEKVEIKIEELANGGQKVTVKGPLAELSRDFRPEVKIAQQKIKTTDAEGNETEKDAIVVTRINEQKLCKSLHGLSRTLISNMIIGVTQGFKKELEIQGVGYRAKLAGAALDFQLGKSHPVVIEPPEGIKFEVNNNTEITITGPDKELVGQIAANIIAERPPEPYKGKGIRIKGQRIKRKAGKSGSK